MRNLILLLYALHSICVLSSSFAIETNEGQFVNLIGPAEVYIDQELDPKEVEYANKDINQLPLEEISNGRTKRTVKYKVLESPGLHSHFKKLQDEEILKINPHFKRERRSTVKIAKSELHSDEVEDLDSVDGTKRNEGSDFSIENIPNAQKQVGNPAYYRSDDSRTMDKRVEAPYGLQSRARKEEEDSHGESSSNVGIKTRTPRVNFITQQGQVYGSGNKNDAQIDGPEARDRERDRDQQNNNNNNNNNNKFDNKYDNKQGVSDDSYRKPSNDRYYPPSYNNYYDTYDRPSYSQYPGPYQPNYYNREYPQPAPYNPYYEKYNPYDKFSGYDKYNPYDKFYDRYYDRTPIAPPPGMSRMTPPLGPSSSFYYRHQYNDFDDYLPRTIPNQYYSDKKFDMPLEPREPFDSYRRPYLHNNDVNVNSRPGRIVYYANLPEVVRTPSNYRYATARYADSIPNYRDPMPYYDRDDYSTRTAKSIGYHDILPSTTMRVSSVPVRSGTARDGSFYG